MSANTETGIPGLKLEYNHDLNVSEGFVASHPLVGALLKDERLIQSFDKYNAIAQKNKLAFHILGTASLVLGLFPLVLAAFRLAAGERVFSHLALIDLLVDACGALAVIVIVWVRVRHYRRNWCQAIFCRERLRQWHFQTFIDGELVSLMARDLPAFQAEIDRRWSKLQQVLRDGYGLMTQFVNFSAHEDDFFHQASDYSDPAAAAEAFDALLTLRFDHQLRFSHAKVEPEGEGASFPLVEQEALSETVAALSLFGAVLVTSFVLVLSLAQAASLFSIQIPLGRISVGVALLLAITSAGTRAYRTGFTLPDEPESYAEFSDRIRELKAQFLTVTTDHEKVRYLKHLEEECAAELRRYLRMKLRAAFIL